MVKFWRSAGLALILSLALASGHSSAQTVEEKLQICKLAGDVVVATVKARNSGVSLADSEAIVQEFAANALQLKLFSGFVRLTYALDGVEAPLMQQVAIQMCQKTMDLK